jgi:hypothetical protein
MADEKTSDEDQAIIPIDSSSQLILPIEMVRRGLELANRISQRKIEKNILAGYVVLCYPHIYNLVEKHFEWVRSDFYEDISPLYMKISVDECDLNIFYTDPVNKKNIDQNSNAERYRMISPDGNMGPITIPSSSFELYYIPYKKWGEDFHFEQQPLNKIGYQGQLINIVPGYDNIYVLVEFDTHYRGSSLHDPLDKRLLIQLKFKVVDSLGNDDSVATRKLYNELLQIKFA